MSRRLLLVEDSTTMRRMISALLEREGYEVATAVDGRDGYAKAAEVRPELIVSDYEMPELDGPGMCRLLKADAELRSIPILMLTTLGGTESKVIGLDAGADDYMEKPKTPQEVHEVFARIRAQLRIADLRRELAQRNRDLEAAQAKQELEMRLARKVQMGLMPRPPHPRGVIRVGVRYTPANALGGDVYDFASLEDGRLGVLAVDISGHGVNAALLSGMVKTLARPLMAAGDSPGEVLAGLDVAAEQYFPEGFFCTGFYLRIEEETGQYDFGGVGHPPAIVVGPHGTRMLDSDPGLLGVGMVAGLDGGRGTLAPGESLLIYTDGLPDAMAADDKMFGTERILAILEADPGGDPAAILDRLEREVAQYVAPGVPHDDINLILIQNPPSPTAESVLR